MHEARVRARIHTHIVFLLFLLYLFTLFINGGVLG